MAIKDLAVAYNASNNSDIALRLAVQMCEKYDASLTGLHVSAPIQFEGRIERWISKDVMQSLRSAEGSVSDSIEATFRQRVKELGFNGGLDWIHAVGQQNETLTRFARYYDILLMGQFSEAGDKSRRVRAVDIVLGSGTPLIIVPNGYTAKKFREHAAIAWDGSRPSARALTDAMQILETKHRLDVITVSKSEEAKGDPANGPDIVTHLQRHGIDARRVNLSASRDGIGKTLLSYCEEHNPDILVMGAFGHSRLREDLFGGVTQYIMQNMNVPVLMSH